MACLALPVALAPAAGAQTNPDYTAVPPPTAPPTTRPAPAVTIRQAQAAPPVRSDRLAVTGSDVLQMALFGGALVVGGGLVLATRRRAIR
ncbi:MAG: hypothetical protein JWM05_2779 [Acidimicrobiales bacterium]|nr:hypothetical protein [Acidimicrobiales bacterium]